LAGHAACMGGFKNCMLCRSEKLNWRENSSLTIVQNSMEEVIWGHRHRWKILTSSYMRCDVAGGTDLAQHACKPRMNVHALCNLGNLCTRWATACITRRQCCGLDDQGVVHQLEAGKMSPIFIASRQPLRPAQPPI
jgi:hypothetical protein